MKHFVLKRANDGEYAIFNMDVQAWVGRYCYPTQEEAQAQISNLNFSGNLLWVTRDYSDIRDGFHKFYIRRDENGNWARRD